MSGNTDQFIEYLLVKCRLVNSIKLQVFTHSKSLTKRIRKQLGWSKVVANVALNAYQEFLELKIIARDYDGDVITPSWCIREVWKTHAICDKKDYEEGCMGVCGHIIRYQVKKENQDTEAHEKFTEDVYKIRYNRSPLKPIWSFRFVPNWKNDYQTEKDLKYSKKANNRHKIAQLTIKKAAEISTKSFYGGGSKNKENENKSNASSNNSIEQQQTSEPGNSSTESSSSNQEQHVEPTTIDSTSTSAQEQNNSTSSSRRHQSCGNSSQEQNSDLLLTSHTRRRQPSRQPTRHSSTSSTDSANNSNQTPNRRRSAGQKRSLTPRNPVMTRARTKMLRMGP